MNNPVFDETMENVRQQRNIELVNNDKRISMGTELLLNN